MRISDWSSDVCSSDLIEVPLPFLSGVTLKLRLDMLVEDEYGLWVVDHKTHKTIPKTTDRLLDLQSPLYVWACHQAGIPVHGFIWNYVLAKAPSVPKMAYEIGRESCRERVCQYV